MSRSIGSVRQAGADLEQTAGVAAVSDSNVPERSYRSTLKHLDVEEWIDLVLHRPLAGWFVQLVRGTPVTPIQVSILSGALGVLAALAIAAPLWGSRWWALLGGLLLFGSVVLDCADGQLARARGQSSLAGKAVDGIVDFVVTTLVLGGFAVSLLSSAPAWVVWPAALALYASLSWHVVAYDFAKNSFLHNAEPPPTGVGGRAVLSREDIADEMARWRREGSRALAFIVWVGETVRWRFERDRSALAHATPLTANDHERQLFRQVFRRHMRQWTWLGLGTHMALLVLAACLAPLSPWPVLGIAAVVLIPGNLLCAHLLRARGRLIAEYRERLVTSAALRAEQVGA